jgi:hypothetical protein
MPPILRHVDEPPGTWPPSPTREPSTGAATGWSPSWAWQPPRSWPERGRSQRSPNGPPTPLSRSAPRSAPASRPRLLRRPGRGDHPSHARAPGCRRPGRRDRRLAGRPEASGSSGQPAAGRCGGRQDAARRPRSRRRRPPGAPAGGDGPRQPRGPGPTSGRRRPQGGARVRPAAGAPGPYRGRGHRGCAADPPRGCRVPGRRQAGAPPVGGQGHQPTLLDCCARLPWHRVPVADRTRDRGHGRVELRSLKAVSVRHFGFPHAAQVIQVTGPHRQRPTVMAVLRNLVVGVLSRAEPLNVAAALRRHARDPHRPLATLGISLG